jgi:catechol-2,3-dioxygenase
MNVALGLIVVFADNVAELSQFYHEALGFPIKAQTGDFVELSAQGGSIAVVSRATMASVTGLPGYTRVPEGHAMELAFLLETSEQVDEVYSHIVAKGGRPIRAPETMARGQRNAFFGDPVGNIHELYANPSAK